MKDSYFSRMKKYLILLAALTLTFLANAQFTDNFNDGDFTTNPTWLGNSSIYVVNASNELQQVDVTGGTSSLYTAVSIADSTVWEFYVRQEFSPSASNYARIYLSSDQTDLNGSLNGYYLKIGGETGANDAIELFRQDGASSTALLRATDGAVATDPAMARVRVIRNDAGVWNLWVDYSGGTAYVLEGTVTDNTYNTGSYIGVAGIYTSTRADKFFYDDFSVSPIFVDNNPPELVSATAISATEVDLVFNEALDLTSAQTIGNYSFTGGINTTTAVLDGVDPTLVHLTLNPAMTNGQNYTVSVINVSDVNSNAIPSGTPETALFNYFMAATAGPLDILINEIMPDPNPPIGLPDAEFVELYNNSANAIDLDNYVLERVNLESGTVNSKTLPSVIMAPGDYVIVCRDSEASLFTPYAPASHIIGLSGFSSFLPNSDTTQLSLYDDMSNVIHQMIYYTDLYLGNATDGLSLELVNPNAACLGSANWQPSGDVAGGTPGTVNNTLDLTFGLNAPTLVSATPGSNTILLVFDKDLDEASAEDILNYSLFDGTNNFTPISAIYSSNDLSVLLTFGAPFTNATSYTISVNNGLTDCLGNAIGSPNSDTFTYYIPTAAAPFDVLINEIMPDPSPSLGSPETEYIELFNRTGNAIILDNFVIERENLNSGTMASSTLPNYLLPPNGYLILCKDSDIALFNPSINVLGLSSFSNFLPNTDESKLSLSNDSGTLIHSVTYSGDSYNGLSTDGLSLELVNPAAYCIGSSNWLPSTDLNGGTAGLVNSVLDLTFGLEAPTLTEASPTSNNSIVLSFDKTLDPTSIIPSNFELTDGTNTFTPTTAIYDDLTQTVTLTFANTFGDGLNYTITALAGVTDCLGTTIGSPNSDTFTYYIPQAAVAYDILINEIYADLSPPKGLPNAQYVELFNRSNKAIDLGGFTFTDGSNASPQVLPTYIFPPNSYVLLIDDSDVDSFAVARVEVGSLPSLNISGDSLTLLNLAGDIIDIVNYDDSWYQDPDCEDGGCSLERINPTLVCEQASNWRASMATIGGTPGIQNSVFDATPDTQAPEVLGAEALSDQTLTVTYNEIVDPSSAVIVGNYSVAGIGNPSSITMIDGNTVLLDFGSSVFNDMVTYTVTVNNVADCSAGNIIAANNTATFVYFLTVPAVAYDILINEIYADLSPSKGLPDAQYVELFNRSNKAIDLGGFTFTDGSTASPQVLPTFIMAPNSYVLLIDDSDVDSFAVARVEVGSLPSLNISGDSLTLLNLAGDIIDIVNYDDSWYQDPNCEDGGCSLERINPTLLCEQESNWRASLATIGGSPGLQNTVYDPTPDTQAPEVVSAQSLSDQEVLIYFSEYLDPSTALATGNYNIAGIGAPTSATLIDGTNVLLDFGTSVFSDMVSYTVTVNNVEDCSGGNAIGANNTATFIYFLTFPAGPYDLLINEIYADPNPSLGLPEIEFLELYNRSENAINLSGYTISDPSKTITLPYYVLASGEYVIIYETDGSDDYAAYGDILELPDFPSLGNEFDQIELADAFGNTVHAVNYTMDWYQNTQRDDGGYTLELINPNNPCEGADNWRASDAIIGGTPGMQNSIFENDADVIVPDLIKAFPVSATEVRLFFSESLDRSLTNNLSHYDIQGIGMPISAVGESPFYNTVILTLPNALTVGQEYTVTVSMLNDCVGNPIGLMNTARFGLAEEVAPGDIIINEVLFNPVTGGTDFVELYNHSNKIININDLILANRDDNGEIGSTDPIEIDCLIFPGEYIALTENPIQVRSQYLSPNPQGIIEAGLPTYDDKEGDVVLLHPELISSEIIDEFHYTSDYHIEILDDQNGVSLERIRFDGDSQDQNNWHSAAKSVGYATPAYQNSQFFQGSTVVEDQFTLADDNFSPDEDGYEDFLILNYALNEPGLVANITVFDARGREIQKLAENEILAQSGVFQWDGITSEQTKARIGVYILYIEVFDLNGKVSRFKKKFVVASRL